MITTLKTNYIVDTGDIVTLSQPGIMNDPTDNTNGNIIFTGTWALTEGTNGGLFYLNITSIAGGNSITEV